MTALLAWLRVSIAKIYAQKKIKQIEWEDDIQNWDNFVKEIKISFSNKSKIADAEWKIETFKQGKKHIADFMIEFEALAMKVKTNNMHVIFFIEKEYQKWYNQDNIGILIHSGTRNTQEVEDGNNLS